MTETTLNKCLNKLDTIIFHDYETRKNKHEFIEILNDTRVYVIDTTHDIELNKRSFMILMEFVNYLIEQSLHPITNQFLSQLESLRLFIIKFKSNDLHIHEEKVDFDEEANSFLSKYIKSKSKELDGDDNDDDEE